ncbi:MAG TPA: hypothetical protein VFF72_08965, partial [Caldimonas sp.]|nr:hypothetical protein [Caldimonas sp.]
EFTMRLDDYRALGGHVGRVRRLEDVLATTAHRVVAQVDGNPWPLSADLAPASGAIAGRPS